MRDGSSTACAAATPFLSQLSPRARNDGPGGGRGHGDAAPGAPGGGSVTAWNFVSGQRPGVRDRRPGHAALRCAEVLADGVGEPFELASRPACRRRSVQSGDRHQRALRGVPVRRRMLAADASRAPQSACAVRHRHRAVRVDGSRARVHGLVVPGEGEVAVDEDRALDDESAGCRQRPGESPERGSRRRRRRCSRSCSRRPEPASGVSSCRGSCRGVPLLSKGNEPDVEPTRVRCPASRSCTSPRGRSWASSGSGGRAVRVGPDEPVRSSDALLLQMTFECRGSDWQPPTTVADFSRLALVPTGECSRTCGTSLRRRGGACSRARDARRERRAAARQAQVAV